MSKQKLNVRYNALSNEDKNLVDQYHQDFFSLSLSGGRMKNLELPGAYVIDSIKTEEDANRMKEYFSLPKTIRRIKDAFPNEQKSFVESTEKFEFIKGQKGFPPVNDEHKKMPKAEDIFFRPCPLTKVDASGDSVTGDAFVVVDLGSVPSAALSDTSVTGISKNIEGCVIC